MKKIAVEEHFHTGEYVKYLFSRKEWPRREPVDEGNNSLVKDWWSEKAFRLLPPGTGKIGNLGEERIGRWTRQAIDVQVLSLSFPGVEMFGPDGAAWRKV